MDVKHRLCACSCSEWQAVIGGGKGSGLRTWQAVIGGGKGSGLRTCATLSVYCLFVIN